MNNTLLRLYAGDGRFGRREGAIGEGTGNTCGWQVKVSAMTFMNCLETEEWERIYKQTGRHADNMQVER